MKFGVETPVGPLAITVRKGAVVRVEWAEALPPCDALSDEIAAQVTAYFAGQRTGFDVPLAPEVTAPVKKVLDQMLLIPFGETRTYGQIAKATGLSAQAVGQACGANPVPVLIPCHRVLGTGSLGGYSGAGGVETKVALLKLEGAGGLLI